MQTVWDSITAWFYKSKDLDIQQQQQTTVDTARTEGFFDFKNRQQALALPAGKAHAEDFFIQKLGETLNSKDERDKAVQSRAVYVDNNKNKTYTLTDLASDNTLFSKDGTLLITAPEAPKPGASDTVLNTKPTRGLTLIANLHRANGTINTLAKNGVNFGENLTDLEKIAIDALIFETEAKVLNEPEFQKLYQSATEKSDTENMFFFSKITAHSPIVKTYLQENATTIVEKICEHLGNTPQATARPS